jgi:hypothetical protein
MSKTHHHNRKPTPQHRLGQLVEDIPNKLPTGIFGHIQDHFLIKSAASEDAKGGKAQ